MSVNTKGHIRSISDVIEMAGPKTGSLAPIFRGQPDMSWSLVPAIHRTRRLTERVDDWSSLETELIEEFKEQGWSLVSDPATLTFGDWMALGRHHGLPTRLLDWSESPLIALHFAIATEPETDGCIWRAQPTSWVPMTKIADSSDADVRARQTSIVRLNPLGMHPRFRAQQGLFTASPLPSGRDAYVALDKQLGVDTYLQKWVIESARKTYLERQLERLGVDSFLVFPDLDGLGQRIARRLRE